MISFQIEGMVGTKMRRLAILFSILCLIGAPLAADSFTGQVVRVEAGDKLVVVGPGGSPHQVRMIGIDAPPPGQPGGRDSRRHLQTLLQGHTVTIEYPGRIAKTPGYAWVKLGGADMNLRQIQSGLARYEPHPSLNSAEQARYAKAENTARRFGMGIWSR